MRREEWHITVAHTTPHCLFDWALFCRRFGAKPLYIELSDFRRQLMCAADWDLSARAEAWGWNVLRRKHEVEAVPGVGSTVDGALYYECHVKVDGVYEASLTQGLLAQMGVSRDLYRHDRWYVTRRQPTPFDGAEYAQATRAALSRDAGASVVGHEYEACLLDSNPGLDAGWL